MRTGHEADPSAHLRAALLTHPTYAEVGASAGPLPAGHRHVRRSGSVGMGAAAFDAAAEQLLGWDVHRRAGPDVEATAPTAVLGSTVILRVGVGPLRVVAPCRVVAVVDEPRRQGFAYGTLPRHPVVGEELFVVTRGDDDRVDLQICAFSRPRGWWVRLGGPVSRRAQDQMTHRYVAAAAGAGRPGS